VDNNVPWLISVDFYTCRVKQAGYDPLRLRGFAHFLPLGVDDDRGLGVDGPASGFAEGAAGWVNLHLSTLFCPQALQREHCGGQPRIVRMTAPLRQPLTFSFVIVSMIAILHGRPQELTASNLKQAGCRDSLVQQAAHYSIPTMYQQREFVEIDGPASYGIDFRDQYQKARRLHRAHPKGRKTSRSAGPAAN
jgi:hypothetical protein